MWLRSGMAMAVVYAGSYSSDLTPSLGTNTCCRCGPKKKKKVIRQMGGCQGRPGSEQRSWDPALTLRLLNPRPFHPLGKECWSQKRWMVFLKALVKIQREE